LPVRDRRTTLGRRNEEQRKHHKGEKLAFNTSKEGRQGIGGGGEWYHDTRKISERSEDGKE